MSVSLIVPYPTLKVMGDSLHLPCPRSEHLAKAPKSVTFVLVTVSTSRYLKVKSGEPVDDISGDLMERIIKESGHRILHREIIPDSREHIVKILREYAGKADVIIFSGGTGISSSDITPDVVRSKADKEIPGFGELFRALSYKEIGPAAMLSRASAYVVESTVVFCLPGSPRGVLLAMKKLIMPEISHIVYHARLG